MKEKGLDQMAIAIKDNLWKNNYHTRISAEWITEPNVRIEKDGKEINTSKSGIKLSYSHPDTVQRTAHGHDGFGGDTCVSWTSLTTTKEELYFGISYCAEDEYLERDGSIRTWLVHDNLEEVKKGTKIFLLVF